MRPGGWPGRICFCAELSCLDSLPGLSCLIFVFCSPTLELQQRLSGGDAPTFFGLVGVFHRGASHSQRVCG